MNDNAYKNQSTIIENTISIHNAGIVILNAYISMLFERLGLTSNKKFTSTESQMNATQFLQYVATEQNNTDPAYLSLNKVLCGLSISQEIPLEIIITREDERLVNGLINAAISYWPVIGDCSVDGFRGNWLVRDGILREMEDRWELTVEKRAYDILINKSPFSFSVIKYPWMEKPMHVIWPF